MARKTFFSFHYKPDCWRASQVKNSWVTQERKAAGFFNSVDWEEVKKKNDSDIEKWIDGQLDGTSVTVVLIGQNTASRKWIKYEIKSSYKRGNGLLGIYIHNKENSKGLKSNKGTNEFGEIGKDANGKSVYFSVNYLCYDWVNDDGYNNMGDWIEKAAEDAGR